MSESVSEPAEVSSTLVVNTCMQVTTEQKQHIFLFKPAFCFGAQLASPVELRWKQDG